MCTCSALWTAHSGLSEIAAVLSQGCTGIPEKHARCIMRQLLTAVRFAHRHGCATSGIKVSAPQQGHTMDTVYATRRPLWRAAALGYT
jgi:hypothetical protein